MRTAFRTVCLCLLAAAFLLVAAEPQVVSILKSTALLGKQPNGDFLLPTNQLLRPWGEQALLRGRPVDMAFDSSKRLLALLNPEGVSLREAASGAELGLIKIRGASYTGIAFRPGDREIWASEVTRSGPDSIVVIPLTDAGKPGNIERVKLEGHAIPAGIAFSADGSTAYAALCGNNTLAIIDAGKRQVTSQAPVGTAPFSVAFSPKTGRVFVGNRGGRIPTERDTAAPSAGAPVATDPATGSSVSGSVTVLDAAGRVLGEVSVGLAPAGLALSPDEKTLAVANGHSDSVSLVQTETLRAAEVKMPAWPEGTFGSQPTALVFSPDGKTLYVACGGTNAIVVLENEARGWRVRGAVPTGWFPSAIAMDKEGALRVVNIKGTGNTSNGKGLFNARQYEGSLLRIPPLGADQLSAGTRYVKAANEPRFEPATLTGTRQGGGVANLPSLGIRHVFLIIKENRTYDQVFGDMGKGNGDPKLAVYGADVTPNHHALAEKYVLLDNFYASGAISFEGHQWLMQGFVSDYVERALQAAPRGYAWNMADALTVSPQGFFWQSAPRSLDVRLYGAISLPLRWDPATQNPVDINEGDLLTWTEYWQLYKQGKWRDAVGHKPGVPALAHLAAKRYPVSSMRIPDQIRAEVFLEELAERQKSGKMPDLSVMTLNSDHTEGTRPGAPTPKAMVADNDLALGRIVEAISKSRFWPNCLILVVEDDAQDGFDHVDGHRTVALAIGPHIRRRAVDSNNYNQTSMIRTIQDIFRIPPRTRFLVAARAMNSVFTPQADLSPYTHLVPEIPLDTMNPPLRALSGERLRAARQSAAMDFSEIDRVPSDVLNRILWWDAKGYGAKYPDRAVAAAKRPAAK